MAAQEKKIMFLSIMLRRAFVIKCNKSPFHYNALLKKKQKKQFFSLSPKHSCSSRNPPASPPEVQVPHREQTLNFFGLWALLFWWILKPNQLQEGQKTQTYLALTKIDDAVLNEALARLRRRALTQPQPWKFSALSTLTCTCLSATDICIHALFILLCLH